MSDMSVSISITIHSQVSEAESSLLVSSARLDINLISRNSSTISNVGCFCLTMYTQAQVIGISTPKSSDPCAVQVQISGGVHRFPPGEAPKKRMAHG